MDKKITLFVFNLDHGGAEKVCVTLCNEFVKLKYEVELWIVNDKKTALRQQLDDNITIIGLNKKHVRNSVFNILNLLIRRKPERILIFHVELAILVIILKNLFFLRTKIIVRSINTLSQAYNYSNILSRNYFTYKIIKHVLPLSSKIIAQSSGMCEDLINSFNIEKSKIVTIFNPALNLFNKSIIIENYNLNEIKRNDLVLEFLYVGRLSPQKGLVHLLNAFKQAFESNKNIHLTIVGNGSEEDMLKSVVCDLEITSNVTFEGYQKDTLPYFKRACATLLTSLFEGFPNVLVESISVGTPVIAFNCPSGPKDIIESGINGILVQYLNVTEFSKAILSVANNQIKFDPDRIIETSKKFSVEKIVKEYEQTIF